MGMEKRSTDKLSYNQNPRTRKSTPRKTPPPNTLLESHLGYCMFRTFLHASSARSGPLDFFHRTEARRALSIRLSSLTGRSALAQPGSWSRRGGGEPYQLPHVFAPHLAFGRLLRIQRDTQQLVKQYVQAFHARSKGEKRAVQTGLDVIPERRKRGSTALLFQLPKVYLVNSSLTVTITGVQPSSTSLGFTSQDWKHLKSKHPQTHCTHTEHRETS